MGRARSLSTATVANGYRRSSAKIVAGEPDPALLIAPPTRMLAPPVVGRAARLFKFSRLIRCLSYRIVETG